ncbi:hypothetical protein PC114_g28598, partial [Phytophthora cactorum]
VAGISRDNAAGSVARGVNKPKRQLALHQRVLSDYLLG